MVQPFWAVGEVLQLVPPQVLEISNSRTGPLNHTQKDTLEIPRIYVCLNMGLVMI